MAGRVHFSVLLWSVNIPVSDGQIRPEFIPPTVTVTSAVDRRAMARSSRGSTIGDAGNASPHRLNQKLLQPLNYGRRAQTGGPSASYSVHT
jgi:hypothetical protein